ncbi:MAG: HAD family phosphatase [Spirochaetota bacterium]|jgi:beta-phosphoglucomutase-like phosphatase (HAD superfamily)|nr:HAD family phosphatase [Spirochaetota bacterium]
MLRAVFLDFDGVIKESLGVKTAAFAAIFAPWGKEASARVCAHHIANGGISRYRKIPMYLREYCADPRVGTPDEQTLVDELLADFANRVYAGVLAAPFVPGVENFIRDCNTQGIPLAVVSGTPEEEMRSLIADMGMRVNFAAIYGSPRGKKELLLAALHDFALQPGETVFVGDSINDYTPAVELGIPFAARIASEDMDPFPENVFRISDFTAITAVDIHKSAVNDDCIRYHSSS